MDTPHIIEVNTLGSGFAPIGTVGRIVEIVEFSGTYLLGLTTFRQDRSVVYVPCMNRAAAIEAWHANAGWYVTVGVSEGELVVRSVRPLDES